MIDRSTLLGFLLLAGLWLPSRVFAQPEVGVEDVVRAALLRTERTVHLDAQIGVERAQMDEDTMLPLPTLALDHEQTFGGASERGAETSVLVEQGFDPSRWRAAYRQALPHRISALRAQNDAVLLDTATAVRAAFFQVLHREARVRVLDGWIARLLVGLEGMRVREASGDVSAFEIQRLIRAVELASARRATEASALAEAWAALEQWTTWESRPRLVGDLQPPPPAQLPNETQLLPDIARLEHLALGLDAERDAWGSPFWRGWSAGVGYRFADIGQRVGHGVLLTLTVPLAYRDIDAPRQDRLNAQLQAVQTELAIRTYRAARERDAAQQRLDAVLVALGALPDATLDSELVRLAQLAFDAGEATLPELLDAVESELELQLTRLDLQWEARRAAIALDRSRGLGVPQ